MIRKLVSQMMDAPEKRGILSMLGAMFFYSLQDTISRIASQDIPTSQILFFRGIFGIVFLVVLSVHLGSPLWNRSVINSRVWIRAGFDVLASATYVYALKYLELANATAIAMSSPFILSLMAAALFKERIGAFRWLSVFLGFVGVLLVVQPVGNSFNYWSLLVLLSAIFIAFRDILTSQLGKHVPSLLLSIASVAATTVAAGLWGGIEEWPELRASHYIILVLGGAAMCIGNLLIVAALRTGAVGAIAQYRYSALLFAALFGFLIWGYVPNMLAWSGFVMIVGSGIFAQRFSATISK